MIVTNKLRICKIICEKRRTDTQITAQIATQIDSQIIGVVTKLKDTIYCNRINVLKEIDNQLDLNNKP
jgi:hypothetical protein